MMIDLPLCGIFQNASAAAQGSLAEPAKARLAPNNVLSVVVLELFEEDESASKRPASNTLAPSVPSIPYEIPTTQSYDIKVIKICLDFVTD
ncbi:hypothetical protein Phum_PHUM097060 [Pediculus humanus corporis]|uniref:Uncharacterized protein n=1 Tax=Pediculus humanus subsp. corporis TaxID=121224 RepID=E0VCT2_PEDHC|nr:uncharacterized protein Phum_PHUM097060 [Pediculus humanus corporis]EEB11188.1 hypothetical protein Phum_PHUM097060 [Pediculus humanus corporis]